MSGNRQAPRAQTIWHHYNAALHNDRRATITNITRDAVDSYVEQTNPQLRRLKLMVGDDEANAKKIHRWLDPHGSGEFPADLEEHLVNALPEPYRSDCIRDLAARYGLLAAHKPSLDREQDHVDACRVMRECADVIEAASKRADDQVIVREALEAIAALTTLAAAHSDEPVRPNLRLAK